VKDSHTALDQTAGSLELLMIPGAPAHFKALYASLAQKAQEFKLALLEPEFIILDTETTGFDAKKDALIEVAAAIVCGNEIIDCYSSFVDPERPIPAHISEITNISNEDVAGAPTAIEVMQELIEFCGNRPIIAHNAAFDQAFIQAASPCVSPCVSAPLISQEPWIDTVELARIALPLLKEYNLEALSAVFAPESRSTHRAIDDVHALVKVWRVIVLALSHMPPGLPAFIARLSGETSWASKQIFELIANSRQETPKDFTLSEVRSALTRHLREQQKLDAQELEGGIAVLKPVATQELTQEFAATGLLGTMYPDYETRTEQLQMATAVAQAFNNSSMAAIEAGTGVGKSMAYLLPAALFAKQNQVSCGVATKSNALLDQLIYHELPRLNAALEAQGAGSLEYLSLKGYDHYPCLRKLLKPPLAGKPYRGHAALVAQLLSYVCQSVSGDIDALALQRSEVPRFEYMASVDDCLARRCGQYGSCLLHSMRKQARNADIVVTNHALLFCDVMSEGSLLPPIRHWIIDEAHGAEGEARRQLSSQLEAKGLTEALRATLKGSGLLEGIRGSAARSDGGELITALLSKVMASAGQADALATSFFSALADLVNLGENSEYNQLELWLNERIRESSEWGQISSTGSALDDRLEKLIKDLKDLISALTDRAECAEMQSALAGHTMTISAALDTLRLILDGSSSAYVYSAQLDRRSHLNANKLMASYFDVGEVLAQEFYPNQMSVVYTSATIALGGIDTPGISVQNTQEADFTYFLQSVGFDRVESGRIHTLKLNSSYDFDTNMTVYVPTDMVEPNNYQRRTEYLMQLDELLLSIHTKMGGSVLTLFTNRREMEEAFERLRPGFEKAGLEVICQYAGTSRTRLREKFIQDREKSLFALRSFWEGFDAPGDTLRCVIIQKLPFGRPNDPLQLERNSRERGAWNRYVLPEAVISLKQAAGRLIRSSSDSGYLVLADTRLTTKFYGKTFLAGLPSQNIHCLPLPQIAQHMEPNQY